MKFPYRFKIIDFFEKFSNVRKITTPGKKIRMMVGPFPKYEDYEADANDFINQIEKLVNFNNVATILDVGCGSGRLIFEIHSRYPKSKFFGFDINPELINWDIDISKKLQGSFEFKLINVYNALYNPTGNIDARRIVFPYRNKSFQMVIAQSVFTHMKYADVQRYLKEIYRVLKPGGIVVVTFFMLSHDSTIGIANGKSNFRFNYKTNTEYINDLDHPEAAVAYEKGIILNMIRKSRLLVDDREVHVGKWWGSNGKVYQDLFILRKET